ncbi:uncharacterized protein K452DRAFT_248315 [Aplosporella prunicola CBS 121167]|uniref:Large ribosomal subunit protein uL5m n=1 Tax=Aplosporella prunicola CBS 121167 TaxID=1176127 RepID=A0A6A6BHS4_9PEZI|nr:uncharacterized protein K452DRAFT_248315 [Aplosporella prunicola CBS 121167]KAF2142804.1 hypothetical protein K452DRAFT_248315 [Aplosporella prunicola CBS 121167]
MALRDFGARLGSSLRRDVRPCLRVARPVAYRCASSEADALQELEDASSFAAQVPDGEIIKTWDPAENARKRGKTLPASRYKFRSPKYFYGPLHPHQPPPEADPTSRLFTPGPFSAPRLEQTWESTIAPDLMTLAYQHFPPGTRQAVKGQRLREWIGDSPYFKNRPLRGPRGSSVLRLLRKTMTFRNVPKITGVTVHTMVPKAQDDSAHLHVAGMVLQAITNARVTAHTARTSVAMWGLREGKYVAVKASLKGEDAFDFLGKTIDLILPRIKEWPGVKGSSGDNSGNIAFGLEPEAVASYPEIEINYDAYPPKMIPGCHIIVHTSATTDREARLLLNATGLPFYGKHAN